MPATVSSKVPPQAIEAERAVLGSCLIEGRAVDKALAMLYPEDFYSEPHREIFRAIASLHERDAAIDYVTVGEELKSMGRLAQAGGMAYLSDVIDQVATAAHVEHYARATKNASIRRQIISKLREAAIAAHDAAEIPQGAIDELKALFLASDGNYGKKLFDMREDLPGVLRELTRRDRNPINTGFARLDACLNGLLPTELVTVGGRTGTGKTAFMLRTCLQMAMDAHECLYITAEMRVGELIARCLPQATNISSGKFRSGSLSDSDVAAVMGEGLERLSSLPIKIVDRPRISIRDIRSAIVQSGCQVVFVDHLQRCRMPKAEHDSTAIYDFMTDFKEILLDTGAIGFLGCQLDRERDTRQGYRPLLRDFRGSSGIESESNIALMLWRPDNKYMAEQHPSAGLPPDGVTRTECVIAKARSGPSDLAVLMDFKRSMTKFVETSIGSDGREAWS